MNITYKSQKLDQSILATALWFQTGENLLNKEI